MTQRIFVRNPREFDRLMDTIKAALLNNRNVSTRNINGFTIELTVPEDADPLPAINVEKLREATSLFARTFEGFVPSITSYADGTVVVVEQVNNRDEMVVHVLKGDA